MKYTVLMSCGHEETIDLVGKNSERERKIEYFKAYSLCKECYKRTMAEKSVNEPFTFHMTVLPYIDKENGNICLSVWFSGNTKPYKDAIKTLEAKGEYELADWMNLAFAYKCTGNWKKSKELLLQAVLYYPEDYRLYMRLCYLECELQDRKPQALKDYSQLKVYYDKAVSLLNGKTGNEEWIQLKSLIVQLKEYGWM